MEANINEGLVPVGSVTVLDNYEHLADEADIDPAIAEKVEWLIETRAENRQEDRYDVIIAVEDWAYQQWSDYDIVNEKILLAGKASDYSEKAFKCRGTFEVDTTMLESRSLTTLQDDTYITSLVGRVDETDEEFINDPGEKFLPKSAVSGIYVFTRDD